MTNAPLLIVTILYALQGALWARKGQFYDALILLGYVVANLGLIAKTFAR